MTLFSTFCKAAEEVAKVKGEECANAKEAELAKIDKVDEAKAKAAEDATIKADTEARAKQAEDAESEVGKIKAEHEAKVWSQKESTLSSIIPVGEGLHSH